VCVSQKLCSSSPIGGPNFGWAPKSPSDNHYWGSPLGPKEEGEEDGENDMRVPFASLYWNEFGVSNLGATARVEIEKLGQ